ncbi:MAG: winged helix-turn-helix transcriptional regulator [Candidatus Falkowbacteria bacterium]
MITPLENKILNVIIKDESVYRKQIADKLELSEDTVKEYLSKLIKKGRLRRVGPVRGGYWEITK